MSPLNLETVIGNPVVPEGAQGMAETPEEFMLYLLL